MGKHSDFRISSIQVVNAQRILQLKRKTEKYFKSVYMAWGDALTKLQTFVFTPNLVMGPCLGSLILSSKLSSIYLFLLLLLLCHQPKPYS